MKNFRLLVFVLTTLLLVSLAACSSPTPNAPQPTPQTPAPNLGGAPWILVNIVGEPAIPGRDVTLEFGADGNIGGNASCNSYFAAYQVDGSALTIGQAGSTMMACVENNLMQQETRYLSLLAFVRSYTFDGNNLVLLDGDGQPLLEFRR